MTQLTMHRESLSGHHVHHDDDNSYVALVPYSVALNGLI